MAAISTAYQEDSANGEVISATCTPSTFDGQTWYFVKTAPSVATSKDQFRAYPDDFTADWIGMACMMAGDLLTLGRAVGAAS